MESKKVQKDEVRWSEINRKASELDSLVSMCSWKESD